MARKKGNSSGFALGILVGLLLAVAGVWGYFKWGVPGLGGAKKPPAQVVNTNEVPDLGVAPVVKRPAHAVKTAPFGISEDVFESGARLYSARCATCHGRPAHDAHPAGGHPARQLWKRNGDAVGVSNQATGTIYEEIATGALQLGMPAFQGQLSETQLWQISLLLKNADQELPEPVVGILRVAR